MPGVIALLWRLLGAAIVPLGWKLLKGLGFAAVSYVGVTAGLDAVKGLVIARMSAVPIAWMNVLGLLQVDVVFSILFSALAARAVLRGVDKSGNKDGYRWGAPK